MSRNEINIKEKPMIPMVENLSDIAREYGVKAFFINYSENKLRDGNIGGKDGIYFVVCPDEKAVKEFLNMIYFEKDKIKEIINNINIKRDFLHTRYCMYHLQYITKENIFQYFQRMLHNIQEVAVVKAVYEAYGYKPPEYISRKTRNVIHCFIDKRYAHGIPKELKVIQAQAMKKFIVSSVEREQKI